MTTIVYIIGCVALGMLIGQVLGTVLFHLDNREFDEIYTESVQEIESIKQD